MIHSGSQPSGKEHAFSGGSAPSPLGFIAFAPGLSWAAERVARSAEIPAPESALGSHPCVALSSAQVSPVWNTSPCSSKTVKDVSGTNCKPCPGLDNPLVASSPPAKRVCPSILGIALARLAVMPFNDFH
jgi:hypothetical protein